MHSFISTSCNVTIVHLRRDVKALVSLRYSLSLISFYDTRAVRLQLTHIILSMVKQIKKRYRTPFSLSVGINLVKLLNLNSWNNGTRSRCVPLLWPNPCSCWINIFCLKTLAQVCMICIVEVPKFISSKSGQNYILTAATSTIRSV